MTFNKFFDVSIVLGYTVQHIQLIIIFINNHTKIYFRQLAHFGQKFSTATDTTILEKKNRLNTFTKFTIRK